MAQFASIYSLNDQFQDDKYYLSYNLIANKVISKKIIINKMTNLLINDKNNI